MVYPRPLFIGLVIGSSRTKSKSNSAILSRYIATLIQSNYPNMTVDIIDRMSTSLILPVIRYHSSTMISHRALSNSRHYHTVNTQPIIREWSAKVISWDAIIVVAPEYNLSFPAILKQALEHLYHEWNGKPVTIISLGEKGGGKGRNGVEDGA